MLGRYKISQANGDLHESPSISGVALVILLGAGMLSLAGCDRVRTTSQKITMIVKDNQGRPVSDVKVKIKESWESWESWEPGGFKESERSFFRKRWENEPWLEGVTNPEGRATLTIVQTAMDESRGSIPPTNRDFVSNREFIVNMETSRTQDKLLIVMEPGTVGSGKSHTVTIEAMVSPKYIQE